MRTLEKCVQRRAAQISIHRFILSEAVSHVERIIEFIAQTAYQVFGIALKCSNSEDLANPLGRGDGVPDANGFVAGAGGERGSVRAERHGVDVAGVALQDGNLKDTVDFTVY